jgi:twinkle protein
MIFQIKGSTTTYDLPVNGEDRQVKIYCPECQRLNKKKDKSLSVKGGVGSCHKCGSIFHEFVYREKKVYARPEWRNKTDLSDPVVKWFEGRRITQTTLKEMKVTEGMEYMPQLSKDVNTIQFNYFQDGELVNIKYRDGGKRFKMYKDAKLILYNIDAIKNAEECIIVEGEIDALTFHDALMPHVVSVPNGATQANQNLEYLDNCIDYFDNKKVIYLATDTDAPGIELRNELLRRLGYARCKKVTFEDCKDANEYVMKYGKERLRERVACAEEFPLEGVFRVQDFKADVKHYYLNGLTQGVKVYHDNLNDLVTWVTGRLAMFTGIPGMGKSEAVDEIITQLNVLHGWKSGIFSPENFPFEYHVGKIAEKLIGKKFDKDGMNEGELEMAIDYINDNFYFILPEDENYSLDSLLARTQDLIYRYGVRVFVLDPWNRIEHQYEGSETKYIGKTLTKLQNFAQRNDILIILVAHPVKMGKDAAGRYIVPNMYDISGSAHFFNQCDYGVSVHRRNKGVKGFEHIEIHVQKVRFKSWGPGGLATFMYNSTNGRFTPCDVDEQQEGVPINYHHNYENYLAEKPVQMDFWDTATPNNTPF